MKTAKKLILFIASLTIACMIILLSCHNRYTGPNKKNIFEESSGDYILPAGYLTQEGQYDPLDPDSMAVVLFSNDNYRIPALTITAKKTILAAVGTGESHNHIAIKKSSDMGKTWTDVNANYSDFSGMYTHPFFINCHNGDILMGIATTNGNENKTTLYRSSDDGNSWTMQTNIFLTNVASNYTNSKNETNCFVAFGQGLTLRHGTNANAKRLMFPYYYYGINSGNNKPGTFAAIMCSEDDGKTFETVGYNGSYSSHEPDLVELSDGTVLLSMRPTNTAKRYWFKGTDWNSCYDNAESIDTMHTDFTRYEFYGKDIKSGSMGTKYALMVHSKKASNGYVVRMTLSDFNNGQKGGTGSKFLYGKEFATNASPAGYPAITVLPDGTIATLTEETNNTIVFRRFNLSWLSSNGEEGGGEEYVDYDIDNVLK